MHTFKGKRCKKHCIIFSLRIEWVPSSGGAAAEQQTVTHPTTDFTISSLNAFTEYTITVYASTTVGEGTGSTVTEDTPAGGGYTNILVVIQSHYFYGHRINMLFFSANRDVFGGGHGAKNRTKFK